MTAPRRPPIRGSTVTTIGLAAVGATALALLALGPSGEAGEARRAATRRLVAELGLTDLALFTEARYTRNPALADLHSAFQDGPASLEHFPTGSLVAAPRGLPAGRLGAAEE